MHDQSTPQTPQDPQRDGEEHAPQQAGGEQVLGNSDMLNVLESVESQIAAIRKAHSDQQMAMETLEGERQALREQHALLASEREGIDAERARVEAMTAELEAARDEASRSADAMAELEGELRARDERVQEAAAALEARERSMDEREARFEEAQAQLGEAQALASRVDGLQQELGERAAALDEAAGRVAELERQLAEAPSTDALGEATGRIETLEGELEVVRRKLDDALASAETRIEAEREHAERLREQLRAIEERGDTEGQALSAAQARVDELDRELEAARVAEGELTASVARLEGEVAAERERADRAAGGAGEAAEALQSRVEMLERELASAQGRVAELEKEAKALRASAVDPAAATEAERLRGEVAQLRMKLAAGGAKISDAGVKLRRERLKRARELMRGESDKLRRAADAVRQRFEQSEQVLAKRAELAGAYREFVDLREKTTKREVRSSAYLAGSALMLAIVMLAGASWFVAGQVMPGRHAAVVALQASGGSREPTADELVGWQSYHETLLNEPSFLGTVADRMKRRGIASLSSPGQLRAALDQGLTHDSPQAGTLRLELVGEGEARTLRVLDTFSTAIASVSNANRTRRGDGLSTVLASEPRLLDGALDMKQVYTAAGVFGGCLFVFFVLVGGLWQRMYRSKAEFERSHSVEAVIDEMGWVDEPERNAA